MSNQNGYIGRSPGDSAVVIASQTFEPTGIQTDFTFAAGYDPGYIDVYFNGARLVYANDYTATNGSTVGLTTYANNGDVLELVAYKAFNVGNVQEAAGNFSVGNQLTVSGVTTATSAYYTGIVTATSFSGDGSALTGIGGTDNIITGVAVTIGGILRVTDTTQSTSTTTGSVIVSGGVGIAKSLHVGGNVTVGGTLTYEDVTNQDVIGLATFRSGVQFGAAGVGGTITAVGNAEFAGIATATQFVGILTGGTSSGASVGVGTTGTILQVTDGATQNSFAGVLVEKASIVATNIANAVGTIDLAQGNVHYFTTNGSGASTADIIYKGGNNLSAFMKVGDNISVSLISKPNNSEYVNAVTIDGSAVTEEWGGGTTPSSASGAASSYTITTINLTRFAATGTPNSDYLVLVNVTNYA